MSKEPLGPLTIDGDSKWFDVVNWVDDRDHPGRGVRRHPGEHRLAARLDRPGGRPGARPLPRPRPGLRPGPRPRRRLGGPHRPGGRELRRDLRAQRRTAHGPRDPARGERAVDRRRPAVRAAVPLIDTRTDGEGSRPGRGPLVVPGEPNYAARRAGARVGDARIRTGARTHADGRCTERGRGGPSGAWRTGEPEHGAHADESRCGVTSASSAASCSSRSCSASSCSIGWLPGTSRPTSTGSASAATSPSCGSPPGSASSAPTSPRPGRSARRCSSASSTRSGSRSSGCCSRCSSASSSASRGCRATGSSRGSRAASSSCFRNVPPLVLVIVFYQVTLDILPRIEDASVRGGFLLSNRGVWSPWLDRGEGARTFLVACSSRVIARARRRAGGSPLRAHRRPAHAGAAGSATLALVASSGLAGRSTRRSPSAIPCSRVASSTGGVSLYPEYLSLLLAMVLYTASFIAEIVRGSIQAVHRGQAEAADALGLAPASASARRPPPGAAHRGPRDRQRVPQPHEERLARHRGRLRRAAARRADGDRATASPRRSR
jgi:hypothetical protein